jgi:hypothetical protein
LFYRVRFQNTGTDTAFTVVIRDTLDPSLDVPSFRIHENSHPMEYDISGEGYVTFTFNNILLPDSFVNEPASHGLVSYFIHLKEGLTPLTEIRNTAAIYFDFNAPIYTNTTLNTIFDISTGQNNVFDFEPVLRPNPALSSSLLEFNLREALPISWEVSDVSGRIVSRRQFGILAQGNHVIPVDGLSSGVYLIRLNAGQVSKTMRLIIGL